MEPTRDWQAERADEAALDEAIDSASLPVTVVLEPGQHLLIHYRTSEGQWAAARVYAHELELADRIRAEFDEPSDPLLKQMDVLRGVIREAAAEERGILAFLAASEPDKDPGDLTPERAVDPQPEGAD